jgi:Fic family protein
MAIYIHQHKDWPRFEWDDGQLTGMLAQVRHKQGRLTGRMESLGFSLREEAELEALTLEVVKSTEIEGEILQPGQVRSSIARRLGMDIGGLIPSDRNVDGVVEMMLDATQNFEAPLSKERLYNWHAALFPTGRSGMYKIIVGAWRTGDKGPMQVVSGAMGRERVHFEAPDAALLDGEMDKFLTWFNGSQQIDPVSRAAIAHFWFITIHPFDDGNGRMARAIADMQLARADGTKQRFYSMSEQIRLERNGYYEILEKTQKGSLDITGWMEWFLQCLDRGLTATETTLAGILRKARYWEMVSSKTINGRQRLLLNKLLDGFVGKLTSSKWAKIAKCSQDTALRDIQSLIEQGILIKEEGGGRSTGYGLREVECQV